MTVMTDISPAAAAAREAARKNGRFGEQGHSAPETTLSEPTAREQRLEKLNARFQGAKAEWLASQDALLAEHISAAWETVPLNAERIHFYNYETSGEGLSYRGMFDANGNWVHQEGLDYRDVAEWANENELTHGLEHDGGYVALRVGKDATRERIGRLQQEWKGITSARSSKQIGDDIDIATTRYMAQVGAEQGFASVELDWEDEGRTGLRATHVTTLGGRRYKAGSGELDDHEILWAAAQFETPTDRMTTTDGVAPFTLTFA